MSETKNNHNGSGVTKSTYYRRVREWNLILYDKNGNEYKVSPKHAMKTNLIKAVKDKS